RGDYQHGGVGRDERDRRKIRQLVRRGLAVDGVGHREDRNRRQRHEDGVAVGRGLRRRRGSDRTARAGAVHHQHRLLECLYHRRRERTADDVGHATRRERRDHRDWFCRICVLRLRSVGKQRQQGENEYFFHGFRFLLNRILQVLTGFALGKLT